MRNRLNSKKASLYLLHYDIAFFLVVVIRLLLDASGFCSYCYLLFGLLFQVSKCFLETQLPEKQI